MHRLGQVLRGAHLAVNVVQVVEKSHRHGVEQDVHGRVRKDECKVNNDAAFLRPGQTIM